VGVDLAPYGGGLEAAGQNDDAREEGAQTGSASRPSAVRERPLGQLADGDEGDRKLLVGEMVRVACLLQT
jgi:hypothetical protein